VTVNVNNGPVLQAGLVIRLPEGVSAPPLETDAPGQMMLEQRPTDLEARAIPAREEHRASLRTDPRDGQQRYLPNDDEADQ
jgi:hypothetical protein